MNYIRVITITATESLAGCARVACSTGCQPLKKHCKAALREALSTSIWARSTFALNAHRHGGVQRDLFQHIGPALRLTQIGVGGNAGRLVHDWRGTGALPDEQHDPQPAGRLCAGGAHQAGAPPAAAFYPDVVVLLAALPSASNVAMLAERLGADY